MPYDIAATNCPPLSPADIALAKRHAPVIRFAANEPFVPSKVGITVIAAPRPAPSASKHMLTFEPGVARIIEYAIWWDWDIGHLYELEHVWLKLDAQDNLVGVDASAHGGIFAMRLPGGGLPLEEGRVTLYSEPGKHAFHATARAIADRARDLRYACSELAGNGLILVNDMFSDQFDFTRQQHRAVKRYLQDRAFTPSFEFTQVFATDTLEFLSWPDLHAYIAERVPQVLAEVEAKQSLLKAVFIDSGDTMVDEASEQVDAEGYVTAAELIPGSMEMLEALAEDGYKLVLVADGRVKSFATVLGHHGIRQHLHAEIISEALGAEKPQGAMFDAALTAAGLTRADAGAVVMIGNHLERDVMGANRLGIVSIWQSWSHRRARVAATPEEVPNYAVRNPSEVPALLELIERQMSKQAALAAVRPVAPGVARISVHAS